MTGFTPLVNNTPILVRLTERRYVVVMLAWPITGGSVEDAVYRNGDLVYGPATYDDCLDWVKANSGAAVKPVREFYKGELASQISDSRKGKSVNRGKQG